MHSLSYLCYSVDVFAFYNYLHSFIQSFLILLFVGGGLGHSFACFLLF